jgi:hypothetical protein
VHPATVTVPFEDKIRRYIDKERRDRKKKQAVRAPHGFGDAYGDTDVTSGGPFPKGPATPGESPIPGTSGDSAAAGAAIAAHRGSLQPYHEIGWPIDLVPGRSRGDLDTVGLDERLTSNRPAVGRLGTVG